MTYTPSSSGLKAIRERLDHYDRELGTAVDDLSDAIEMLRLEKRYAEADRIRTITGRIARLRTFNIREDQADPPLIRTEARNWK